MSSCDCTERLQGKLDYMRSQLNDPVLFKNIYRYAFDFARVRESMTTIHLFLHFRIKSACFLSAYGCFSSSLVWFLCRIKISAVLIWTLQKPCWHFSLEGRGLCSQFSTNFWRFVIFFFKSGRQICCQAPHWVKKHHKSLILPLFFIL